MHHLRSRDAVLYTDYTDACESQTQKCAEALRLDPRLSHASSSSVRARPLHTLRILLTGTSWVASP